MEQFPRQGSGSYSLSSKLYLRKLVPISCYIMTLPGTVCEVTNSSVCWDHIRLSLTYNQRQIVPRICMKLRILFFNEKSWSDSELSENWFGESYWLTDVNKSLLVISIFLDRQGRKSALRMSTWCHLMNTVFQIIAMKVTFWRTQQQICPCFLKFSDKIWHKI